MNHITLPREAVQLACDLIESYCGYTDGTAEKLRAALARPETKGCACRWDADDNRVATCTRHQGWLDVVQEWSDRAKEAESKLAQPEPCTNDEWLANCPQKVRDFAAKVKAEKEQK